MSFLCCCCLKRGSSVASNEEASKKTEPDKIPEEIELPRTAKEGNLSPDKENVFAEVHQQLVELSKRSDSIHKADPVASVPESEASPVRETSEFKRTPLQQERIEFQANYRKDLVFSLLERINALRKEANNGAKPLEISPHLNIEASIIWTHLARLQDGFVICGYNCCACTENSDVHGCLTYFTKQAEYQTLKGRDSLTNFITMMWYANGNVNWYVDSLDVQSTTYDRDRKYFRDTLLNPLCKAIGFHIDLLPRSYNFSESEKVNELCLTAVFDKAFNQPEEEESL